MGKKKNTYEENMKKLEDIAGRIERGDMGLDQTIELFEEGMKLAAECQQFLGQAELKVNKLLNGENGKTTPFKPEQE